MSNREYKSLSLDREKIIESMEECLTMYYKEFLVHDLEDKGGTRKRSEVETEMGNFYMDFHFNTDGTTTIEDFGGSPKYIPIKKEIAKYIKDNCTINCSWGDSWFVAKDIDKSDFDLVLEILQESEYNLTNRLESIDKKNDKVIYKLRGKYNEQLTITYYSSKTVMIQGKQLLLFNEALVAISELLEVEDIPKCYNELYKLKIDKDSVRQKVKIYMQNSYDKLAPKLNKCIHQAVYYLLIDADMFEYSAIPLTAFRALEGHVKYVLKSFGFYTTKRTSIGSYYVLNEMTKKYELNSKVSARINDDRKKCKLEEAYNQYHNLRNIYSHWDDLLENSDIDSTAMIDDMNTAKTQIISTLKIIDSYYML